MKEMDMWEASEKLSEKIIAGETPLSGGYAIQFFIEAINDGESPKMALVIALSDDPDRLDGDS